ncbi:hypothetical protein E2C01_023799 [Portunus trituberculatus]|uniref:Uncharacterized protein n=1 Tax=Portunus trituberculatus TaxID=210409 RepID=A0A5B7E946_PORTR|nr:hypothetical protein [Portunus trituberculatus]
MGQPGAEGQPAVAAGAAGAAAAGAAVPGAGAAAAGAEGRGGGGDLGTSFVFTSLTGFTSRAFLTLELDLTSFDSLSTIFTPGSTSAAAAGSPFVSCGFSLAAVSPFTSGALGETSGALGAAVVTFVSGLTGRVSVFGLASATHRYRDKDGEGIAIDRQEFQQGYLGPGASKRQHAPHSQRHQPGVGKDGGGSQGHCGGVVKRRQCEVLQRPHFNARTQKSHC